MFQGPLADRCIKWLGAASIESGGAFAGRNLQTTLSLEI